MKKEIILIRNNWLKNSSKNRCLKCLLITMPGQCHSIQNRLNMDCQYGKFIYKTTDEFTTCTKENTNVGDFVYCKNGEHEPFEVKYIPSISGSWDIVLMGVLNEFTASFKDYMIENK